MDDKFRLAKAIVILLVCSLAGLFLFWRRDYTDQTLKLDKSILNIVRQSRIDKKNLLYEKQERYKSGRYLFLKIERHYEVGEEFDADSFLAAVAELIKRPKFSFTKLVFEKKKEGEVLLISFSLKNRNIYEIKFLRKRYPYFAKLKPTGAKIAIVLDDFGYNINDMEALFKINSPLTISILPNLPYSERIAAQAREHNFEVILHLPLEPHNGELNLEKGTLMTDMAPQEVNDLLAKAIVSVPGLKGVSNHMGSKATEDRDFMGVLFKELKKRDLYFLDNLVTDKSVCREVAREVGLCNIARSVFLDNRSDESYIEKQIFHTAHLAAKTGWAVGIGHYRPRTIKVLTKVIPQLEKAGFEFVYVSQLVK